MQPETKFDVRKLLELKSSFNPLFFWLIVIWMISKGFQLLLGSKTTIWESLWMQIVDSFGKFPLQQFIDCICMKILFAGDDEFKFIFWGWIFVSFGVFWMLGSIFIFLDLTLKPESLRKYKIQTQVIVDRKKLIKVSN